MLDTGIYYIATGDDFVREAEISARSVRSAMPDVSIAIATDVDPEFNFDHVIDIPEPEHSFADQIYNLHRSPFDKTLHLDTDIYIGTDASELFDLLDRFDIAAAYNHNREVYDPPGVPSSFPEYNTGVVVYENNRNFEDFLQEWEENYIDLRTEENTQNQPSFRKTLYESDLRITTLTPEYNCMVRYPGHVRDEVKIAHSRLLDIETAGAKRSVDVVDALETLNRYEGHRLYVPEGKNGVSVIYRRMPAGAPIYKRAVNSIQVDGISKTAKKGLSMITDYLKNRKS